MNHKAVCRTAPATPGLSNMLTGLPILKLATVPIVCNCLDSMQLYCQSATVLTNCNYLGCLKLSWKSETVLTVSNCLDSLKLSGQSVTVLAVYYYLNRPWFVPCWHFFCLLQGFNDFESQDIISIYCFIAPGNIAFQVPKTEWGLTNLSNAHI